MSEPKNYARRVNYIHYLVENKVPKDKAKFEAPWEEKHYDALMKDAKEHLEQYGFWPTYQPAEVD